MDQVELVRAMQDVEDRAVEIGRRISAEAGRAERLADGGDQLPVGRRLRIPAREQRHVMPATIQFEDQLVDDALSAPVRPRRYSLEWRSHQSDTERSGVGHVPSFLNRATGGHSLP